MRTGFRPNEDCDVKDFASHEEKRADKQVQDSTAASSPSSFIGSEGTWFTADPADIEMEQVI